MTPFDGEKPPRGDRINFPILIDAFITWLLDVFWPELDTAVKAFNFNATNCTSTTSTSIASGVSKTITVQTGKSLQPGMEIICAYTTDPTNRMIGVVITYDSGTGALEFYSESHKGSGTYAVWTISQTTADNKLAKNYFRAHTPSGHGSTNTKIRKVSTIEANVGTAFTIDISDAAAGMTVTINEDGLYQFSVADSLSSGTCHFGISVNSNQLSQSVSSITLAHRRAVIFNAPASSYMQVMTEPIWLEVGDIVRWHTDGTPDAVTDYGMFKGCKLANA